MLQYIVYFIFLCKLKVQMLWMKLQKSPDVNQLWLLSFPVLPDEPTRPSDMRILRSSISLPGTSRERTSWKSKEETHKNRLTFSSSHLYQTLIRQKLTGFLTSGSVIHRGKTMGRMKRYVKRLRLDSGHDRLRGWSSSSSSSPWSERNVWNVNISNYLQRAQSAPTRSIGSLFLQLKLV